MGEETKAQRDKGTCPRLYRESMAEMGLEACTHAPAFPCTNKPVTIDGYHITHLHLPHAVARSHVLFLTCIGSGEGGSCTHWGTAYSRFADARLVIMLLNYSSHSGVPS